MKPYQFSEVLAMIMFSEHYQLINGHLKFTLLGDLTYLIQRQLEDEFPFPFGGIC